MLLRSRVLANRAAWHRKRQAPARVPARQARVPAPLVCLTLVDSFGDKQLRTEIGEVVGVGFAIGGDGQVAGFIGWGDGFDLLPGRPLAGIEIHGRNGDRAVLIAVSGDIDGPAVGAPGYNPVVMR